jgi:mRNA-degrading endonuclease RelE of RelBE toxin-antitoxin system
MSYNVLLSLAVKDYIRSQNRDRATTIFKRLKELRKDPLGNSKKLEPPLDRLRSMRIGGDRVLFSIRNREVYVELMDDRKNVYDKAKRMERRT